MSYSFLDFGLTKLNIFSSMVLTYTSAQRECSHNTDYARAVKRCSELCVCWAGQKVSYRRTAWEALAVERMLRNDEEYKEYLEDIEPYHREPVGYLKYFSVKKRDLLSDTEKLCLVPDRYEEEKQLVYWFDKRQAREPSFPHVWKADQRVVL
nr:CIC_HP1_G0048990.mRNA.1.CDS.1 [Saccharomyces cerevisiae]